MGILGGLFGRSQARKGADPSRCMECGITGGTHTDWCPAVAGEATMANSPAPPGVSLDPGPADEQEDPPPAHPS